MKTYTMICWMGALAALAAGVPGGVSAADRSWTTPDGVTLIEVVHELDLSSPNLLWIRPGDADGRTLFASSADTPTTSRCVGTCAREWLPLVVSPGAKPSGDWTVVKREDGSRQWAYRKRPLYTWTKETIPGDVATTVAMQALKDVKIAEEVLEIGTLMPPAGWEVVRFEPTTSIVPAGMEVRLVPSLEGVALTDAAGFTLYEYNGNAKRDGQVCDSTGCNVTWVPLAAPAIAAGVGDFSVVDRLDGTRQWAFRGRPLYRYRDDRMVGDAGGVGIDAGWRPAFIAENFRPKGVSVSVRAGFGEVMTADRRTLYIGTAFQPRWGGRNQHDNFRNAYIRGHKLGGNACVTPQCLATWAPLRPSVGESTNGFWQVISREDGTKQWAYKGYAVYTRVDDAPNDVHGNDSYDMVEIRSDPDAIKRAKFLADINGRSIVYWHTAKP